MTPSTPTLVDARVHATAIKAALNAALGVKVQAYDYDEVPGASTNPDAVERRKPLPNIYVAVSVERRFIDAPLRVTVQTGRTGWRIAARSVGRTVDECRWAMFQVQMGLNEQPLTIGGTTTTPIQFESEQAPEWDDARYSAVSLFTYVH